MNNLEIDVTIIENKGLRYTRAGIPVLEMLLENYSKVIESGLERKIRFQILSVAMGKITDNLIDMPMDYKFRAKGFIASAYRGSALLKFHLQEIIIHKQNILDIQQHLYF
ncbi:primosomal replication protein N priB [Candidatus Kinetoplastibacterium blastocrithidii TCC012E]|uniref:Primosomal replication protein N priB n=1 Tax=Candidatus Kinetoplastidibacterium blastocrithidiae TCC012E TaxID=1208922 RepID=M1LW98_9PROT|nr:primosomal replication protein N [Candidatus Kinetoplastibacterium blastocrithidii]AFZ83680.1 primosomal replication protein N [Candidatus Kinetoplastibacterium blastocrithidii (ex Strigomonas culicis)]AGF49802.1 primosomal replication protein N priB [Candidatus Kinetoplastibacterium blastocrithidii TCC012E]